MNILVPVNKPEDVEQVVAAGATELYCGVLPETWRTRYSNVVSPNRREWSAANLKDFDGLAEIVRRAHKGGARVLMTLNALYTAAQYPLLREQIDGAKRARVDALIVADLGLLLALRQEQHGFEVHISTGGTTFNARTARFYQKLGASRITFPRHVQPAEMAEIIAACPGLQFEAFVLNSGCKNIDGFCTFLHGTAEMRYGALWKTLKRMNFDRQVLRFVQKIALRFPRLPLRMPGVDSPCLWNYRVAVEPKAGRSRAQAERLRLQLRQGYHFLAGVDPCAACRVKEFMGMGLHGLKIVGRNYSTEKKVSDVRFLKSVLALARRTDGKDFEAAVRAAYKEEYGLDCGSLCYYPK